MKQDPVFNIRLPPPLLPPIHPEDLRFKIYINTCTARLFYILYYNLWYYYSFRILLKYFLTCPMYIQHQHKQHAHSILQEIYNKCSLFCLVNCSVFGLNEEELIVLNRYINMYTGRFWFGAKFTSHKTNAFLRFRRKDIYFCVKKNLHTLWISQ